MVRQLREDDEFLIHAAGKILGGSNVATSTADRLVRHTVDAGRLGNLLLNRGREVQVGGYKFKLIDADPETPDNFGVLVRRVDSGSEARLAGSHRA